MVWLKMIFSTSKCTYLYMGVSKNNGTPKSSILIGFSIIFTIHFGGPPLFLETPIYMFILMTLILLQYPSRFIKHDSKICLLQAPVAARTLSCSWWTKLWVRCLQLSFGGLYKNPKNSHGRLEKSPFFIKGSLVANFRYTNFWVAWQE